MRPPGRRLAPQGQNHAAVPQRPSGGGIRGPGDPPSPPPPPGPSAGRGCLERQRPRIPPGGPLHPGGGHHSRGERSRAPSAPGRPPAHSHITRCQPATDRRQPGMRTQRPTLVPA